MTRPFNRRILYISGLAMGLGFAAALIAQALTRLIGFVTNLAYFGRISTAFVSPADHHLGAWSIFVPVIGGVIVGIMARYGSRAIRGHGIPEAMEQVLVNGSRIPARITFLKPLSAAIAIGTGGPFGAEGPIIATGGALGSVVGQLLHTTAIERKTLLAAGAAAGMTATFGSPIAAVLLAIELLLFEFRARTFVPVALAAVVAAAVRNALSSNLPVFPMAELAPAGLGALFAYLIEGALIGAAAVFATKIVYAIEDTFERLPVHWMWWPAMGGLAVGLVGLASPHTLGVGYDNIEHVLSGELVGWTMLALCGFKFISWSIALGSGTSGGTLAPLFTIGGGLGSAFGVAVAAVLPVLGVDYRVAALVGMAAIFTGASRALLASVVFAFETTGQRHGLLPLLAGCSAAHVVSSLLMTNTIMTEKIARRGVRVPADYVADVFESLFVRDHGTRPVTTLSANSSVDEARAWLASDSAAGHHQGYPLINDQGQLVGVLTRRDIQAVTASVSAKLQSLIRRPALTVSEGATLRDAINLMLEHNIGRLPVVNATDPLRIIGILTRGDLLSAQSRSLEDLHLRERSLKLDRRLRVNVNDGKVSGA